jgi:hypothetical protein
VCGYLFEFAVEVPGPTVEGTAKYLEFLAVVVAKSAASMQAGVRKCLNLIL